MNTVTIFGSWWGGNLGDTAILKSTIRAFREVRDPSDSPERIIVHSSNPDVLSTYLTEFEKVEIRPVVNNYWGLQTPLSLAESDAVVIGGGGLFFSNDLYHPYRNHLVNLAPIALLARATGTDSHVLSVGASHLGASTAGVLTSTVLRGASTITARDPESVATLSRFTDRPVDLVPDPAFGLEPRESERVVERMADVPPETILVSLHDGLTRHRPDLDRDAVARTVVDRVGAYAAANDRDVLLYNNYVFSDWFAGLADAFEPAVTVHVVEPDGLQPEEVVAMLARCDRAVCSQMHVNVMCALAGTPTVAVEYDRKVRSAMAMLGRESQVTGLDEIGARVPDALAGCRPVDDERLADLRRRFEEHVAEL